MLPLSQEAIGCFEVVVQRNSREIPRDVPQSSPRHTELVSSTAGITHSSLQEPCSGTTFPGKYPRVQLRCTDIHLPARLLLEGSHLFCAFRWLPGQAHTPAACSVHTYPTPLLEHLPMLGSYWTFLIFHLSAPHPIHLLRSESFGCFACDSPELRVILALSSCSVIHAEWSPTPPSGNN